MTDIYLPKNIDCVQKHTAIVIGHQYGRVIDYVKFFITDIGSRGRSRLFSTYINADPFRSSFFISNSRNTHGMAIGRIFPYCNTGFQDRDTGHNFAGSRRAFIS